MIENLFRLRIEIKFLARPIRARRHDAGDGMGEAVLHRSIGLLAAAQALQPVGHVREVFVANSGRRQIGVARQLDVPALSLLVDVFVLLVIANLLHDLPTRTTFSAGVVQGGFLSHDAAVADGVVSTIFDLGGSQTIVVRHGKYFTTYNNLSSTSVEKGQEIKAGKIVGRAASGLSGEGQIIFMVTNDKNVNLDPENWLKRKS